MNEVSFMFTPTVNTTDGLTAKTIPKADNSVESLSFSDLLNIANQKSVNELRFNQLNSSEIAQILKNLTQQNPTESEPFLEISDFIQISDDEMKKAIPIALDIINLPVGITEFDFDNIKIPDMQSLEISSADNLQMVKQVQNPSEFDDTSQLYFNIHNELISFKNINFSSKVELLSNEINTENMSDFEIDFNYLKSDENSFRNQFDVQVNQMSTPPINASNIPIIDQNLIASYTSQAVNEQINVEQTQSTRVNDDILAKNPHNIQASVNSQNIKLANQSTENKLLNFDNINIVKQNSQQFTLIKANVDNEQTFLDATNVKAGFNLNDVRAEIQSLNRYHESTITDVNDDFKTVSNENDVSDKLSILNHKGDNSNSKNSDDINIEGLKPNLDTLKPTEKTHETLDLKVSHATIPERFVIDGKEVAISPKEVLKQVEVAIKPIVNQILNGKKHELVVELNPVELGKIKVELVSEAGKISVKLITETEVAAQILTQRSASLQEIFKSQNLQLENYQLVSPKSQYHAQDYSGSTKNSYQGQEQSQNQQNKESDFEFEQLLMM